MKKKKGEENRKQEKLNPEMYEEEKKVLHQRKKQKIWLSLKKKKNFIWKNE